MPQGDYEQVGGPGDTPNINPYTGQAWDATQGFGAEFREATPEAALANLLKGMGNIKEIVGGIMGEYAGGANATALLKGKAAARAAGTEYSNISGVGSGAYESAIARGMALPFAEAARDIAGRGVDVGMGLASKYLGLEGERAGSLAQLYGSGVAALATPEYYEPTYAYKQGFWDYVAPMIGQVAGAAAGGVAGATKKPWWLGG